VLESFFVAGTGKSPRHASLGAHHRLSVGGGKQQDLLKRGAAIARTVNGHHAERSHALGDGDLAHFTRAGAGDDEFADFVADSHGLDDSHTARITGILTAVAAASAIKRDTVQDARVNVQVLIHLGWIGDGFLAMRADAAHEALCAGENHRR